MRPDRNGKFPRGRSGERGIVVDRQLPPAIFLGSFREIREANVVLLRHKFWELRMRTLRTRMMVRLSLLLLVFACSLLPAAAQCPARPPSGTVVQDALNLYSQNGSLDAAFVMGYGVDSFGYTHYCYKYDASTRVVEAPTLRL